jgi:hypothetical protein
LIKIINHNIYGNNIIRNEKQTKKHQYIKQKTAE